MLNMLFEYDNAHRPSRYTGIQACLNASATLFLPAASRPPATPAITNVTYDCKGITRRAIAQRDTDKRPDRRSVLYYTYSTVQVHKA